MFAKMHSTGEGGVSMSYSSSNGSSTGNHEESMRLRVCVEVGDSIVGITGEENYTKSAFRPSPEDIRRHKTGPFVSWKDHMFQHPLMTLSPHPMRLKVYREMVPVGGIEQAVRGELVAWAQDDDLLLREVWRKPNRCDKPCHARGMCV